MAAAISVAPLIQRDDGAALAGDGEVSPARSATSAVRRAARATAEGSGDGEHPLLQSLRVTDDVSDPQRDAAPFRSRNGNTLPGQLGDQAQIVVQESDWASAALQSELLDDVRAPVPPEQPSLRAPRPINAGTGSPGGGSVGLSDGPGGVGGASDIGGGGDSASQGATANSLARGQSANANTTTDTAGWTTAAIVRAAAAAVASAWPLPQQGEETASGAGVADPYSTFDHFRELTLSNPTSSQISDYQVRVELNSSNFNFSEVRSDGLDFAFFEGNSPLPFYREYFNASGQDAVFWLRVPSIPASGSTVIQMFYGDPNGEDLSDGEGTFIRFEDFSDGLDDWTIQSGVWSLTLNTDSTTVGPDNLAWQKQSVNPMFAADGFGVSVIKHQNKYYVYYRKDEGSRAQIHRMSSNNGLTGWVDDPGVPVIPYGPVGSYDQRGATVPQVWIEGSTWYMMYAARDGNGILRAALATSSNGVNWTKDPSNPIAQASTGHYEPSGIFKVGNTYYMWHNNLIVTPGARETGLATSTNLKNWTEDPQNPLFVDGRHTAYPFFHNGSYWMLIGHYRPGTTDFTEFELWRSSDPRFRPQDRVLLGQVLTTSPGPAWDDLDIDVPWLMHTNINRSTFLDGEIRLYYGGTTGTGRQIGVARESNISASLRLNEVLQPGIIATGVGQSLLRTTTNVGQNVRVGADVLFAEVSSRGRQGVGGRYQSNDRWYGAILQDSGSESDELELQERNAGSWTQLSAISPGGVNHWQAGIWYPVSLAMSGSSLVAEVNDRGTLRTTSDNDSTLSSNGKGLIRAWADVADIKFRNFRVGKYQSSEPNVSVGAQQSTSGGNNTPPTAEANGPYATDEGLSLAFASVGSNDPDGTITSYQWDFGDGNSGSGASPSHTYADDGNFTVTLTVTDNNGATDTDTASVTVDNVAPTASAGGPYNGFVGVPTSFAGSATDPGSADTLTYEWDFDYDGFNFDIDDSGINLTNPSNTYGSEGSFTVGLRVSDDDGGVSAISTAAVNVTTPSNSPGLTTGTVAASSTGWTLVDTGRTYVSPVVVVTANYGGSSDPIVARVRNANGGGSTFEVMLTRTTGSGTVNATLHWFVVEEGVYTAAQHGIKMEAVKFLSTVTDAKNNFVGQAQSYANSYTNPVVLGQVMTTNDSDYSEFWSQGSSRTAPPSSTALTVGKHVGEDSDTTRSNETIGYVVFEAGGGSISGRGFTAGVTGDVVAGFDNSPPYNIGLSGLATADTAIAVLAGLDGADGGWAILYGSSPVSTSTLRLAVDEDQVGDTERSHQTEQVAYIVFEEATGNQSPQAEANGPYVVPEGSSQLFDSTGSFDPDGTIDVYAWDFGDGNSANGASPSHTYDDDGAFTVTLTVTDNNGSTDTDTAAVTVDNVAPTANAGGPYNGTVNNQLTFAGSATDPGVNDTLTYEWDFDYDGFNFDVDASGVDLVSPSNTYTGTGTFFVALRVSDGDGGTSTITTAEVTITAASSDPALTTGVVSNVSSTGWTVVNTSHNYTSPVVVATPNYYNSSVPLVVRVRNAAGSSFEITVARTDGQAGPANANVHWMVVEEGVYTQAVHGVTMEAVKYLSTVTDENNSWVGQSRSYANAYTNPVVLGQVMTANDADFSSFWSRGGSRTAPPSASTLFTGKHVGEDSDTSRSNETVGYIVLEAGNGTMSGVNYTAALGSDTIRGLTNSPPYTYALSGLTAPQSAIASQAAMDGNNGSWPVLYGNNPVTSTTLNLAVDEDQANDTERNHTTEQVAYIVFDSAGGGNTPPTAEANGPYNVDEGSSLGFSSTGSNDPDGSIASYDWNFGDGDTGSGASPSHTYDDDGNFVVTLTVTDNLGATGTDTASVTVNNVAPTADAGGPYNGTSGVAVTFAGSATDPGINDTLTYEWDFDYDDVTFTTDTSGVNLTAPSNTYGTDGSFKVALRVSDGDGGTSIIDTATVTISDEEEGPALRTGIVTNITNTGWTTVNMGRNYASPVVVVTPNYDGTSVPVVARVRNVNPGGSTFEVMLARTDGQTGTASIDAHWMAVEEGVYTQAEHGVEMEAVIMESTVTDHDESWDGQNRGYANNYASPVVVGQVMTANDADWSVFWASGFFRIFAPSTLFLQVGKHVGEDPDIVRANETIGYIVIEAGSGSIGSTNYVAAVGGGVGGMTDSPPYSQSFAGLSNPQTAVATQTTVIDTDGAWAVLFGNNPVAAGNLDLVLDEDQADDAERSHGSEQVAYIVFD